jgi:hypothetical protein
MGRIAVVLATVSLAASAGCGGGRAEYRPVSEADFGRLEPEQLGPDMAARAELDAARDAAARAERRRADSRHEAGFATADLTAARSERERALAELRIARESADQGALGRAQDLLEAAELRRAAAEAHAAYAERLARVGEAGRQVAQARVALAQASLQRARLAALEQANVPAASKYDPRPLDARVAEARAAYEEARARSGQAERESRDALARWRSLVDRYQARAPGPAGRG